MADGDSVDHGQPQFADAHAVGDLATPPEMPSAVALDGARRPGRVEMPPVVSNRVARCLRRWIGVNEALLDSVPGDRTYFTFAVVLAMFVAMIDGVGLGVLMTMTVGQSSRLLPIGVGVGFVFYILFLDLSILTPEPYNEVADVDGAKLKARRRRSWTRLAVAVLLGFFVALGLTAAVFAQDVNRRAALDRTAQIETATKELRTEQAAVQKQAVARPNPEVKAAQAAQAQANGDLNQLNLALAGQRAECNAEINGTGGSGLVGQGPRADLKCAAATQLSTQVDAATQHLAATQAALDAAVKQQSATAARTASAVADIKIPRPFKPSDLGPIDRISATHRALGNWEILVALVLIAIDCAPVLLKQTKGVTDYERLLGMHHAEIIDGSRSLAQRSRLNSNAEGKVGGALTDAYTDAVVDVGVESMRRIAAEKVRANESVVITRVWDDTRRQVGDQGGPPVVDIRRVDPERHDLQMAPPTIPPVNRSVNGNGSVAQTTSTSSPGATGPSANSAGPVPTFVTAAPNAEGADTDPKTAEISAVGGAPTETTATGGPLGETAEEEARRLARDDPGWLARALTEAMQGPPKSRRSTQQQP